MLIQGKVTIAAGAVNDNLLAGSQYEFLPWNAKINFGVNGDATGNTCFADVYSGSDVLAESMMLNTQNRIPVNPDDFSLEDYAQAGERIKIRVRNTSAANRDVFFAVVLTPIG